MSFIQDTYDEGSSNSSDCIMINAGKWFFHKKIDRIMANGIYVVFM